MSEGSSRIWILDFSGGVGKVFHGRGKRRPFLYKYFTRIPEQGEFVFLDGGWMRDIVGGRMSGDLSDKEYRKRVDSTKRFERTLADNGYLVMKFFFQIDKHEQKKRLETLLEDDTTKWRVSKHDLKQNKSTMSILKHSTALCMTPIYQMLRGT